MTKAVSWRRATARPRASIQFRSGCRRHHRQGSKSAIVRTSSLLSTHHESTTCRTHLSLLASRWLRSSFRCILKVSLCSLSDIIHLRQCSSYLRQGGVVVCLSVTLHVCEAGLLRNSVCISGYPLSGYPDLSVNFLAAKNPDILK